MKKATPVASTPPDKPVEIVVVLDRSGSMDSVKDETIHGYNRFLSEQRALPGEAKLTTVLFNQNIEISGNAVPLDHVDDLTDTTYVPSGFTALNDAVGRAISGLNARNPERALICIITDGEENASREYTAEQVKSMILAAERRGWRVVYLGANQDAFAVGAKYGVNATRTATLDPGSSGIHQAYFHASLSATSYRSGMDPMLVVDPDKDTGLG